MAMRFLHTADWHAGRQLMGRDRTPEVAAALMQVAEAAREHSVDVVLAAGDLFDTRNPSADAEHAVWSFFRALGDAGIPSVAIAGNHDSPRRLDAVAGVLRLTRAHIVGEPRSAGAGGVVEFDVRGTPVRVAALPFMSERRIVRYDERRESDDAAQKRSYRDVMASLVNNLTAGFDSRGVNLLMLHGTTEHARLSASEYQFHSTTSYTLGADIMPGSATYLAMGHMHMAQGIAGLAENRGRYSGSLVQLDFGEQGDRKHVFVMEAEPGRPAELVAQVEVTAGRQLRREALTLDELDRRTPDLAAFDGWLKIALRLDEPRPGIKDRIIRSLPNVIAVEVTVAGEEPQAGGGVAHGALDLPAEYARYYREARGMDLPERLGEAFAELHAQAFESEAGP